MSHQPTLSVRNLAICLLFCFGGVAANAQALKDQALKNQIERGHAMIEQIKLDLKEKYYDPRFRGIDLEAHFKAADAKIEQAVSGDQIYGIIAESLIAFGDSHVFFTPPVWDFGVDYGWSMKMIGNKCFVTAVANKSDAHMKQVEAGDIVHSIFDIPVTRKNLWEIKYLFYNLRPLRAIVVTVESPSGKRRRLELATTVYKTWVVRETPETRVTHPQLFVDAGPDLFIWRMPSFDLDEKSIDEMMMKFVGQPKALMLDLRGNSGGMTRSLRHLVGYFFDHDVNLYERRGRKSAQSFVAKSQGSRAYTGKLVVLTDSSSASAAEIFARVVQLEKRGTVVGDTTAGAVNEALPIFHEYRQRKGLLVSGASVVYGVSVTINDLLMTDGGRLEGVGVTPDQIFLPTPADLAASRDSQLIHAAGLVGVKLDPDIRFVRAVLK